MRRAQAGLHGQLEALRTGGGADAGVRHRVQRLLEAVDQAARALEDDHLRAAYARHLE